ncbi:hypothetical protein FA15DRAFT_27710 [Coprinopsis marcescibilis]|uniref:ATP-dependent DNA helicase n=1 Tax=Coprinopsis marcescibilis TaxID=230819 RepID=A0A5C3LFS1_COPMA|nr:hypothetical protein FA15DRAFT_27710 [Coprinopsis marcescibilis]
MPKAKSQKFYAVLIGRDAPQIYDDWENCKDKVSRYPGAVHKSFKTRKEAEAWLGEHNAQPQPLQSAFFQPHGNGKPAMKKNKKPSTSRPREDDEEVILDEPEVKLSPEQRDVLERVKAGKNVFFTGSAGTGKSVLLREIIKFCGGRHSPGLAITASTGIASVNIGGTTLHSWAGIGLGLETAAKLAGKFFGQPKFMPVLERWKQVKTLIIDESQPLLFSPLSQH